MVLRADELTADPDAVVGRALLLPTRTAGPLASWPVWVPEAGRGPRPVTWRGRAESAPFDARLEVRAGSSANGRGSVRHPSVGHSGREGARHVSRVTLTDNVVSSFPIVLCDDIPVRASGPSSAGDPARRSPRAACAGLAWLPSEQRSANHIVGVRGGRLTGGKSSARYRVSITCGQSVRPTLFSTQPSQPRDREIRRLRASRVWTRRWRSSLQEHPCRSTSRT